MFGRDCLYLASQFHMRLFVLGNWNNISVGFLLLSFHLDLFEPRNWKNWLSFRFSFERIGLYWEIENVYSWRSLSFEFVICNLWALICVNTCACSMCFLAGFMSLFVGLNLLEVLVWFTRGFRLLGFCLVLVFWWFYGFGY